MDPFDPSAFFALRSFLERLDPEATPTLETLTPLRSARSVAVLPGSFNPPTAAHMLLAERALSEGFECVVLILARKITGKEPGGLIPEDRLLSMRVAAGNGMTVAGCSHGLLVDQAGAVAERFPQAEISFLLGSDKVVQLFEHRWYDDRDAALDRLFDRARLIVAPRSEQGERLRIVLQSEENRRWAHRVSILRLHPAVSDLSSTRVRGLLRAGADPSGLVPAPVGELLGEMRAFAPPLVIGTEEVDAYEMRARLLDLLWRSRGNDGAQADLRTLVRYATSSTEQGRRLRARLLNGKADTGDLVHPHHPG